MNEPLTLEPYSRPLRMSDITDEKDYVKKDNSRDIPKNQRNYGHTKRIKP